MARDEAWRGNGGRITGNPDEIPSVPDATELDLVECCYELFLLVEAGNPFLQNPRINDKTSYFDFFDTSINAASIILAKCVNGVEVDQVTITDSTYGEFLDFGVEEIDPNLNYISLKNINWTLIYDTFGGAGKYQFRIETLSALASTTTVPRKDFVYHLEEYTNTRANTTVFMKHFNYGNFADPRTNGRTKFTYPADWSNGKRVSSIFGNDSDELEDTYTVFNTGFEEPIDRKFILKYQWEFDSAPQCLRDYIQFAVRSARLVEITNYQNNNPTVHDTIPVQATGGFDPEYLKQYSQAGAIVEFKHAHQDNYSVLHC